MKPFQWEDVEQLQAEVARLRDEAKRCADGWDACGAELRTERAAHEATKAELERQRDAQVTLHGMLLTAEQRVAELECELAHRGERMQVWIDKTIEAENVVAERDEAISSARDLLEQGKAQRDRLRDRVAELERECERRMMAGTQERVLERELDIARAALSSARELLETPFADMGTDWNLRRGAWLHAHPEPATPAATALQANVVAALERAYGADWREINGIAASATTGEEPRCAYEGCQQIDEGEGKCFHGERVKKEQKT